MKKANVTTLASVLVIALVAAGIGMGTMAFFSDTETSGPNVIVAGTIDLELTGDFDFTDVKPCEDMEPIIIQLKNVGQNDGYLYQKIDYIEKDKVVNGGEFVGDITADEFAALIYVKSITYNHIYPTTGLGSDEDDLPGMKTAMDDNGDGYVSLYEMKVFGWMPYSDVYPEVPGNREHTLKFGEGAQWTIVFHMADSLLDRVWGTASPVPQHIQTGVEDNAPQADGIDVTWTAVLRQNPASVNPLPPPGNP